jgi:hypothetical protein
MGKQQPSINELFPKKNLETNIDKGLDINSLFPKKKDDTALSGNISSTVGKSELPDDSSAWYDWDNIKKAGANLVDIGKGLGQEIPSEVTRMIGDTISSFGLAVDLGGRYSSAGINYLMGNKKQAQKDIDSDPTFLGKYLVDAGNYLSESANQTKDDTLKNWGVSEKNRSPERTFYDAFSDGDLQDGSAMLFRDVLATVPQAAAAMLSGGGSVEAQALRTSGGLLRQGALSEIGAIASTELPAILSTGLKSQTGAQFKFGLGLGTTSSLAHEYQKDNHVTATDFLESIARGVIEGASESLFDTDILAAKKIASRFVNVTDNPAIRGIMASIANEGEDAAKEKIVRTTTNILGKAFAGGRNEGLEEVASSFGNMLIDATKQGGFTMNSLDKFKKDAVESFIVGALSGGAISGGAARLSRVKLTDIQQKTIDRYNEVVNDESLSDDARNIAKQRIKDILDYSADVSKENYRLVAALPKEKRAEALDYLSKINQLEDDRKSAKDLGPDIDNKIKSYEDNVNKLIEDEYKTQRESRRKESASQVDIDTEAIINLFQSKEKQGFSIEDMDSALNDIRNKINAKEEINQNDINTATDNLYNILNEIDKSELTPEQKKIASEPFFNQIDALDSYEKTVKISESTTPIQEVTRTTKEIGRIERPKTTILTDRFDLEPVQVTNKEGNTLNYVARVDEKGSITLVPKIKFSRNAEQSKQSPIQIDSNLLQFQESIKDENDRVIGAKLLDKKTGNIIEISNPELAIDLATRAKQETLGNVSEGVMQQETTVKPIGELTSVVKEFVNKKSLEQKSKEQPQFQETINQEQPATTVESSSPVGLPARKAYVVTSNIINKVGNRILNKVSPENKTRINNYVKSIKSLIPDLNVVLYDNKQDMIQGLVNQGHSIEQAAKSVNESNGLFSEKGNTIHIDVTRMDKETLAHEIFHPLVLKLAKENPAEFNEMRNRISKVLSDSDLAKLDKFAKLYAEQGENVSAEEFLSQLAGLITTNKVKFKRSEIQKIAMAIKDFLKKVAVKINSKQLSDFADSLFSEKTKTEELIKFFEGYGKSLRQGTKINANLIGGAVETGQTNTIREQRSYPDALSDSRREYEDKNKNTFKDIHRYIRKLLFERNINVKKAMQDAELEFSLYTMYNKAGASMFGNLKFTERFNEIYGDLNANQIKLADSFIFLRRVIAIDTNFDNRKEQRPKHTSHNNIDGAKTITTKESALSTLEDYKDFLGEELYDKIYSASEKYFNAFSDILKYKYENGLISKDSYELYKDYNYSPRKFLKFVFGTSISEEALSTNNFYQRGLALSANEIKNIENGSDTGILVDSAKLLHAAMIATEVRVASNLALKTLYEEAIPQNLDFVKEVEYEKNQDGTIKINEDGSLKYNTKADDGFRIVTFKQNGLINAFQLKEDLAKEYFDEELFDKNSKAYKVAQLATGANILRNMATGMNLAFPITNIPIDVISQVQLNNIYDGAGVGVAGQYVKALKGTILNSFKLIPIEFGKNNKEMEDLIYEYGKAGGLMMSMSQEYAAKDKFFGAMAKYLGSFGNASEMASKLNAYKTVKESEIAKFKSENNGQMPSQDDMAKIQTKAAYMARAAMDYHRGGLLTKWVDGFVPYLNVFAQGTKITVDYMRNNPKAFTDKIVQTGLFVAGLTIYNMAVAGSDYDNDDNEQDLTTKIVIFMPFKNADGTRGKIEIGAPAHVKNLLNIFQNMGEGIYHQIISQDEQRYDAWKTKVNAKFVNMFSSNLATNIPPALKALIEYSYNLDLWRGGKIYEKMGQVLPQDEGRYDKNVAEFYKIIGSATGKSPKRMQKAAENFITQSNPLVGVGYTLMDKMINQYQVMPESERSKFNNGKISDIPVALFDKIAGRAYSVTDPSVKFKKNSDVIDKINQEAGSKKMEVKAEMKLLIDKNASLSEMNTYLSKQDPIYRRVAKDYAILIKKDNLLKYPSNKDEYFDIMMGANSEAKAQIMYSYFPHLLMDGNQDLRHDLKMLNLYGEDTKRLFNQYYKNKGIPK